MSKPKFKIKDGVLIKCYDNGCEVVEVPDTVTEIGENAFHSYEDCRSVKEIILPNTVKKICFHAFHAGWRDCGLEKVNIPSSVEWISTRMFANDSHLKDISFDDDSYLVGEYPHIYSAVPLPYLCDWPLPINLSDYRKVFRFDAGDHIEKIFIYYDESWLKAVSVEEFLSLIEEVCKINKLYLCKYEWNGSLIGGFSGGYKFSPLSPDMIYFKHLPDYFEIKYTRDTLHEDKDGWPGCGHETKFLRSSDGRKVCFDTSEDDMSSYYGENRYIELLENYEDSPFYDNHDKKETKDI